MKTFKLLNIFIIVLCLIPQTLYSQLKKTSEIEKVKSFTNGSIILSKIKINEVYIYALTIPNNSKYHEDIVFYLGEEKDVLNNLKDFLHALNTSKNGDNFDFTVLSKKYYLSFDAVLGQKCFRIRNEISTSPDFGRLYKATIIDIIEYLE